MANAHANAHAPVLPMARCAAPVLLQSVWLQRRNEQRRLPLSVCLHAVRAAVSCSYPLGTPCYFHYRHSALPPHPHPPYFMPWSALSRHLLQISSARWTSRRADWAALPA
jgi:hypothetical protein